MSKQPEALRLADALENGDEYESFGQTIYGWIIGNDFGPVDAYDPTDAAANELRCLHAVNSELLEALKAALSLIEIVIPFDGDVTRMVRKAIAKAEGGV